MSAIHKTAHYASQAAIVFVALTLPASIIFGRGALAVSLALALLSLATAAAAGLRWPPGSLSVRIPLALAAFVAVAWLPAVAASLAPAVSALTLLRSVLMVLAGIVLAVFLAQDRTGRAERFFIAGMVVAELFAFAALFIHPSVAGFRSAGAVMPHMILKASASAIACAVPLLIYAGWRLGGWWRGAVALCLLLGFAIMFGTGSKSSLAGLLASSALCGIVALSRTMRPARLIAVILLAAGLAGLGLGAALRTTSSITVGGYALFAPAWLVDQHRQVIWQFTLDRFWERPWFGWGLNVVNTVPGAGETIPELQAEYIPSHPHNWMIETLAESGVAGFLPLLAVVLGGAVLAALRYRRSANPAWLAWLALWLTYWSAGAFNFSMWNTSWQASGMVLAALACSHFRRPAAP